MSLLGIAQWLQDTAWSTSIRESTLMYPAIEASHLLVLAFSVGTIVWVDMRLLGWAMRREPLTDVLEQLQPYTLTAFALAFATGLTLLTAEPVKCYNSPVFRFKMIALALAGVNAFIFHNTVYRSVAKWDQALKTPPRAKLAGAMSLLLWTVVIALGRWQAYS
jgi:hypothetical protein